MRSALALAFLFATACNPSARPPKCPSQGGRWIELTTPHLAVVTDLGDDEAHAAAVDYETAFEELRAVAFPRAAEGPRITIVLFQNESERWAFRPVTSGADYIDQANGDIERSPTIILSAVAYPTEKWLAREEFLHELTHRFVAFTYGAVPIWLNEGLAQYLSTMHVEDGMATLGDLPYGYRLTRGYVASVGELLAVDRRTFYGNAQQTIAGENARLRYYRGSWAFVHFLHNGPPPIRAGFQAFIQRLDGGAPLRDAWRETLGRVPKAEIERGFSTYVTADSWTGTELPLHLAQPASIERSVPLRDEEVHLLWARLANRSLPATDPRSEEAQLAEAERAAPGSPEVRYRRGCVALEQRHEDDAAKYFEAALADAPDEPRYLFGALEAFAAEQASGVRGIREKAQAWRTRLAASARSADELSLVARTLADEGDDRGALHYADAAILADRSSYGAFASRAFVHFRGSRYAEAVADQEHALGIAWEGVDTAQLARVLEAYRETLGAR